MKITMVYSAHRDNAYFQMWGEEDRFGLILGGFTIFTDRAGLEEIRDAITAALRAQEAAR